MVGNDAQRRVAGIFHTCQPGCCIQQILEQINFIIAVYMLQHCGQSLQPHAGVHRRFWQRYQLTTCLPVKLHKYQVPDFNIAVTVFIRAAGRSAEHVIPMVVEYLRTGTAGTRIAHLPEI